MGAVASGRSVRSRSPRSVKRYISLRTMSEDSPTPLRNTPLSSKTGVWTSPAPEDSSTRLATSSTHRQRAESSGSRSRCP
jgi:hypothetical protein